MTRRFIMFTTLFAMGVISIAMMVTGCSDGGNSRGTKNSYDGAGVVAERAIEEFLEFCKVPHPSGHTEKALAYFQAWAEKHCFSHFRDNYGNFWMDVPATAGYEQFPKVILQCHMDMVCIAEDDKQIDFENDPITPIYDEENKCISADRTSLGGDNGNGVGVVLAVASSNVPHGPLRIIITADEEVGLLGAQQLPSEALDSDYLINIDNELVGEIIYSSAGFLGSRLTKQYQQEALSDDEVAYSVYVSGLRGGHSGVVIQEHRLHALFFILDILMKLDEQSINYRLYSADVGKVVNAIPSSGTVELVISANDVEKVRTIIASHYEAMREEYPLEEDMEVSFTPSPVSPEEALSKSDTKNWTDLLRALPQGVIAMKEDSAVQTSANNGSVVLNQGLCSILFSARSCVDKDLNDLEQKLIEITSDYGYQYDQLAMSPGWDGDYTEKISQLIKEGYESEGGIKAYFAATHGGLELSWFVYKRPSMQMVCIGATVDEVHTTKEKLHTDTVEPLVASILYTLKNINR